VLLRSPLKNWEWHLQFDEHVIIIYIVYGLGADYGRGLDCLFSEGKVWIVYG